jgi:hypothetical protein
VHVQQLQHFAFGDHVGGVGEDLHDAHAAGFHHHLEGARIEEVAHQDAGGVAEHRIGGIAAAAQFRFVDHVVMQQRGGVDELDHRGQFVVAMAFVVECACGKQQDDGAQTLAARPMMYSPICSISGTSDDRRRRMTASTARMSAATGASRAVAEDWDKMNHRCANPRIICDAGVRLAVVGSKLEGIVRTGCCRGAIFCLASLL